MFGEFSLDAPLEVGSEVRFADAAGYTMVKTTWFNGLRMPSIVVRRLDGTVEVVREFGYDDFKRTLGVRRPAMKKNLLIIGAGGVAHVAAHKSAMHNDVLGDICIASRTVSKCEAIIDSVSERATSRTSRRRCTRGSSTPSTSPPPRR